MTDRKTNRCKRNKEDGKADEDFYRYVDERISVSDKTKEMSFCINFIRDFLRLNVNDDIIIEIVPIEAKLLKYFIFSILLEYHDWNSK